jgi:hypothetical protein
LTFKQDPLPDIQVLTANYTVVEGFDDPEAKFSDQIGNILIVDCHKFQDIMVQYLPLLNE